MSRSRSWCFTINNPSIDDHKACDEIECSYIVYGIEVGNNGTQHIQGYIEFKEAKTMSSTKKLLGGRGHFESRRGTPLQASDYCKKEGTFLERGSLSSQGKRTDLQALAELVKAGGVKAVVEEMPGMFIKHHRGVERLAELTMKERDKNIKPKVVYLWGKTGTGKTKEACETDNSLYVWTQPKGYWWNGYTQQHRVVIDDYHHDDSEASFRYMLQLLDRYPISVQTKGGMLPFNSPEIYITSEFPPDHWFTEGNRLNQFLRRIDELREIKLNMDVDPPRSPDEPDL